MIDSLTSSNHRDFNARYCGTWGYYVPDTGSAAKVLVTITHVDADSVHFEDPSGGKYLGYANKGLMFEFIPINRGFFDGIDLTYYLARHPARQWYRGIHEMNTLCSVLEDNKTLKTCLLKEVLPQIFYPNQDVRGEMEKRLFNCTSYLNNTRNTVALTQHFALVKKKLMFYTHEAGAVVGNKIHAIDIIGQELRDAIRRNNLPFEVV
jgi:hypothetical protein